MGDLHKIIGQVTPYSLARTISVIAFRILSLKLDKFGHKSIKLLVCNRRSILYVILIIIAMEHRTKFINTSVHWEQSDDFERAKIRLFAELSLTLQSIFQEKDFSSPLFYYNSTTHSRHSSYAH